MPSAGGMIVEDAGSEMEEEVREVVKVVRRVGRDVSRAIMRGSNSVEA